jgi:hypothetical protein
VASRQAPETKAAYDYYSMTTEPDICIVMLGIYNNKRAKKYDAETHISKESSRVKDTRDLKSSMSSSSWVHATASYQWSMSHLLPP